MALDPLELIIIGVIVVVVLMWGPGKIPELARAIGRARREFEQASKEVTAPGTAVLQASSGQAASSRTSDEVLIDTARQLGIATEGKTREQISQEIIWKSKGK